MKSAETGTVPNLLDCKPFIERPYLEADDAALLASFAEAPIDDMLLEQLNQQYTVANSFEGIHSITNPAYVDALKANEQFYTLLGVERDEQFASMLQSQLKKRKFYPAPMCLVENARLFASMGIDPVEAFRKEDRCFTARISTERVVGLMDALRRANVTQSFTVNFIPLLQLHPETVERRLAYFSRLADCLQLPISVPGLIERYPRMAMTSSKRMRLLAQVAIAFGDKEAFLLDPEDSAQAMDPEKLYRRIAFLSHVVSIETVLGIVLDTGRLASSMQTRIVRTQRAKSREDILRALEGPAADMLGPTIVKSYFACKPLTKQEIRERSPDAETPPPPPTLLDASDTWLRQLADVHETSSEAWLTEANDVLLRLAELPSKVTRRTACYEQVAALRTAFFDKMGWTNPRHPMYESFCARLVTHNNFPPNPTRIIGLVRVLQPYPNVILKLLQFQKCCIVDSKPEILQEMITFLEEHDQDPGVYMERYPADVTYGTKLFMRRYPNRAWVNANPGRQKVPRPQKTSKPRQASAKPRPIRAAKPAPPAPVQQPKPDETVAEIRKRLMTDVNPVESLRPLPSLFSPERYNQLEELQTFLDPTTFESVLRCCPDLTTAPDECITAAIQEVGRIFEETDDLLTTRSVTTIFRQYITTQRADSQ